MQYLTVALDWNLTWWYYHRIYKWRLAAVWGKQGKNPSLLHQINRAVDMLQYGNPLYTCSSALSATGCAMAKFWAGKLRGRGDAIQSCTLNTACGHFFPVHYSKPKDCPFYVLSGISHLKKREEWGANSSHDTAGSIFPPRRRGLWQTPIHHPSVIW